MDLGRGSSTVVRAYARPPRGRSGRSRDHPPIGPGVGHGGAPSDLLARHAGALIELRIVANLWPLWDAIVGSTHELSGLRLRSAQPPPRAEPLDQRA
jgi:hypothetical protein